MTLLELLIALSILVMVAGTLAALATGVQQGFECTEGRGLATQHARVALERIAAAIGGATANEQFPGCIVLAETVGGWRFPDTLVVWHPDGAAADPRGLPRLNELVIYCPNPAAPNELLEITAPDDTRAVPPLSSLSQWAADIDAIKRAASSRVVVLTGLMRTASPGDPAITPPRGAVRFETRLRPSQSDWDRFCSGTLAWADLPWVQGICGSQTGLRQVWVRTELQLMPGEEAAAGSAPAEPVPFLGSAALYYQLHK